MSAFLTATGAVAIAEIGDKTQLLSFILAARFRKPVPIILGILVATLANHALAGAAGAWVMSMAGPGVLRWVLGVLFIAMAAWTLVPDKLDGNEVRNVGRFGVFGTTVVAFFIAAQLLGVGFFLPTIVKGFGLTNMQTGLVSIIPPACGAAAMIWALARSISSPSGESRT